MEKCQIDRLPFPVQKIRFVNERKNEKVNTEALQTIIYHNWTCKLYTSHYRSDMAHSNKANAITHLIQNFDIGTKIPQFLKICS